MLKSRVRIFILAFTITFCLVGLVRAGYLSRSEPTVQHEHGDGGDDE